MKISSARFLSAAAASLACVFAGTAVAAKVALVNPGFESKKPGVNGNAEGWQTFQHAGPVSYDFVLDSGVKKSGTQSMRVRKFGPEVYGSVTQLVPAAGMSGKRVRLSAWMKTDDVPARGDGKGTGAALMLIALRGTAILESEMMRRRQVKGTTPWARHSIELDIPAQATVVEIGAMLQGGGTMWIDDFELEVLDR